LQVVTDLTCNNHLTHDDNFPMLVEKNGSTFEYATSRGNLWTH